MWPFIFLSWPSRNMTNSYEKINLILQIVFIKDLTQKPWACLLTHDLTLSKVGKYDQNKFNLSKILRSHYCKCIYFLSCTLTEKYTFKALHVINADTLQFCSLNNRCFENYYMTAGEMKYYFKVSKLGLFGLSRPMHSLWIVLKKYCEGSKK